MKVLIVGAGGQGAACASILSRQSSVSEIRLADLDASISGAIAAQIGSSKIKPCAVDAMDSDSVAAAAAGASIVVDMVMPWMVTHVMRGALKAGAHYINTAFDTPFWDELVEGKSPEQLTLSREFQEAGLTALFGCGFAPGWTNVLARRLANRMDKVDKIRMRVAKKTILPGEQPYDYLLRPWNPGWSPKQALIDYATPTYAVESGKYVKYPPFGGLEIYNFPAPVGEVPVTHHSHEEIYSIPATFKGVTDVDFKYCMLAQPAVFYAAGLCSQEEIQIGGAKVKPIDVVAALMPKPSDNIFSVSDEKLAEADRTAFVELAVEVAGTKDGKPVTWVANCPKMNAPGPELKKLYGTALVYVGLPLAVGILMLNAHDLKKGIIFADELDPETFIHTMMETGYPYQWKETKLEG